VARSRPGEDAGEALLRLVRERLGRKPGGHLVESGLESLDLRIVVALQGPDADPLRIADRLTEEIDRLLDDAVQQAAAFRPGHAFCHRCESVSCQHSRPPSCRHVCVGYAATGMPRWEDFAQFCLERRHPRVDELYREPPALLTVVHSREALHGGMLAAFENPSYDLLGQLTAGFFPVRARAEEGRGVLALTVQVAASRSARGAIRLGLNLLGRSPAGEDLERLWDRQDELPWRRSVRWAQSALQTLTVTRGGRAELERRVDRILHGLARRLDREHRARGRRTRHAAERHASGVRPTRKALDDARAAADENLFVDERNGTLVVVGERGRTHFFTAAGQHVSSVRYSRDAIARKLRSELWRRASPEQSEQFRRRLALAG
jgi:hypothetical protein